MMMHVYGHVSFITILLKATFCGVPLFVFDKLVCAVGKKCRITLS